MEIMQTDKLRLNEMHKCILVLLLLLLTPPTTTEK